MIEDHFALLTRFFRKTRYIEAAKSVVFTGQPRSAGGGADGSNSTGGETFVIIETTTLLSFFNLFYPNVRTIPFRVGRQSGLRRRMTCNKTDEGITCTLQFCS